MKQESYKEQRNKAFLRGIMFVFASLVATLHAQESFKEYKGVIKDANTNVPLVYAGIGIDNSNIHTITNSEGEFLLKVPTQLQQSVVVVSFLGYKEKKIPLSNLSSQKNKILLEVATMELTSIEISNLPKDPKALVRSVLKKTDDNYFKDRTVMTAFYRETIKKRRKNVSLSEAVVNVYKQSYLDAKKDVVELYKSRKKTDYSRLDTLALKLQGGPFNALYVDVMKYPEYIFGNKSIDNYRFRFKEAKQIDDNMVYVVAFEQLPSIDYPLYYGDLFIDAKTLALTSATYSLNLENKKIVSDLFVKRKPKDVKVQPVETIYHVDYREKDGKWYYGYSNVQLAFKVNWKSKLFNSVYKLTSEMAITDWEKSTKERVVKDRIRPNIVIADEASGFSDPEFWGEYNVIEPEKSIESAINKIQRQLKRAGNTNNSGTSASKP